MIGSFAGLTQDQWLELGRDIVIAIVILLLSHFVAKAVKWTVAKGVDRIPFFPRRENVAGAVTQPPTKVGERVGEVAYWLVWLLGLIAALNVLQVPGVLEFHTVIEPLNGMLQDFVRYVPNVVGAALIFAIGFALATIVRRMVEAMVQAVELDRRLVDAGLTHTPRGEGLSRIIGILVFTLIIIPVSIAALTVLEIDAISLPAINMLNEIMTTIPDVVAAAFVVFIAYLIGRWLGTLAEEGLRSMGFDDAIRAIGNVESIRMGMRAMDPTPDVDTIDMKDYPPSRIVGIAVLAGTVLFASVEAARLLGFDAISQMLAEVLALATRMIFGAIIIAVGVLIANVLAAAAARGGTARAEIMGVLVRWGVIMLAAAVGLRQMGLANDIIAMAFGLTLGAIAVAVAISFGIGGIDSAKRVLDRWTTKP